MWVQNDDHTQFCIYCGANLTQNNELENPENIKNPSKLNSLTLMLDFSAIGKGLVIGLIIGIFTAGFIGLFFGSIVTGYYITIRRWKYVAINGFILGFISGVMWSIISFLFTSSTTMNTIIDIGNIIGSTGLAMVFVIIGWLIGLVIMGLVGAIGALIGSKFARRNVSS